ncbi:MULTISPECIES: Fe-S protein assembly co-chaperone HscB [Snodgrassella]|uniref:Fe-S protein assembly co-chaperone HscB n=1 Tax=Snodgrassella TaxID=1193515 RepID=UPI002269EBBC|nr:MULTISPECIES: Fe-S protein assembly co-chaperone HscB [unclassified Snodgrassella]MCT6881474.1 Fe-S protein assembly co-chaperone HscB [Snodgrassella alvi]MCX8746470.1 Fe-S protein assembly co-chaperone HscB [Snodgrassella sp. B3800]MCX8749274.1 Fe-S protein assembly co-chaperone HscB [Snodgrassella sp. B3088]MCX8753921.1 Fe-S protein assembly co-chaperone HscB [Snodgrassella sp. B3837]
MNQYFALFQLPEQFNIDIKQLEQNYHLLAAQCHPDKFAASSSFEQKQAMMMAATVNEAYRILCNPLDRAAYLLQQKGIDADAPEHTHFPAEFLIQQMQWRETLEDARAEADTATLHELATTIQQEQNHLYQKLDTAFAQNQADKAAELVRQGRFLYKLNAEIQAALL